MADYLKLREFAEKRGMRTDRTAMQRLRRRLTKKQRRLGKTFLFQLGEDRSGPIFVTEPLMRQYCPELFDRRAEAIEMLKESVGHIEGTLLELKRRDGALAAKLRETIDRLSALELRVIPLRPASKNANG